MSKEDKSGTGKITAMRSSGDWKKVSVKDDKGGTVKVAVPNDYMAGLAVGQRVEYDIYLSLGIGTYHRGTPTGSLKQID